VCKLRAIEFVVLSYLCYHYSHNHSDEVSAEAVAGAIHITARTAKRYLAGLVNKRLVTENGVPVLRCEGGKFFTLPNEIFLLSLPPSAFVVYAYLLLVEDRRAQ